MQRPRSSGSRLLVVATLLWAAAPLFLSRPDAAMVPWLPRPGMTCVPSPGPVLRPPTCIGGTCPASVTATDPGASCEFDWDTCARFPFFSASGQITNTYTTVMHPSLGCVCHVVSSTATGLTILGC